MRWYIIILWSGVRQKSRFCKCNAAKPLRFGKGPVHKVCGNTQSTALLAKFKPPVWRFFIVFYLYYDLGAKVKPRDDTTALKLCGADKVKKTPPGWAVGTYRVFIRKVAILYAIVSF